MGRTKGILSVVLLIIVAILTIYTIPVYASEIDDINSSFNEADLPGYYEGSAALFILPNEQAIFENFKYYEKDVFPYEETPHIFSKAGGVSKANIVKAGDGFDIDLTLEFDGKVEFHETLHAKYNRSTAHANSDFGSHRLYDLYLNGVKLNKYYLGYANREAINPHYAPLSDHQLDWYEYDGDYELQSNNTTVELLYKGNIYRFLLHHLKKTTKTNDDLELLKNIPGMSKVPDDVKKLPPWLVLAGGAAAALIVLRILAKILKSLAGGAKSASVENDNDGNNNAENKNEETTKEKKNKKDKKLKKYLLQISKPELEITAGGSGTIGITAWYVDAEGNQGIATNAEIKIMMNSVPNGVIPAPSSGYGKITCSFSIPQDEKEGSYTVEVMAEADGNTVSASFVLKIHEAKNPAVDVDNDFVYLLCKSGDKAAVKTWVENPGDADWKFDYQFIEDGGKQNASVRIEKAEKNTASVIITDIGMEPVEGDYDVRGAILITATDGKQQTEGRRVNITICREGIYVTNGQDADGKIIIRGDLSQNDAGWKKELDIAVMEWDEVKKELVSDATAAANIRFSAFTGENENTTAVLTALPMKTEFVKPRPGNIAKGVYAFYFDHVIPGMQDDELHGQMKASVNTPKGEISSEIKFAIKTTKRGEGLADWKKELDQCTKFIGNFIPEPYQSQKLKELDIRKDQMGAEDFKEFRAMCWEVAYYALMKDKKSYDNVTYWAEAQVTTLEWVQWIGDRAFALAVGTLTGTYLAFIAAQLKDAFVLFIQKYQESNKSGWDFLWDDIIQDRLTNLLGSGLDSSIMDMPDVKFSSPTAIGWVSMFFLYKVTWHWMYDMDDGGSRKGLICAVKASMLDLTATTLEKGLGDFVKQSLGKVKENKNGRFSSELIGKLDSLLTKGDNLDKNIGDTIGKTNIAKTFGDAKDSMTTVSEKIGASVVNTLKLLG